jgi:hypothetical protein
MDQQGESTYSCYSGRYYAFRGDIRFKGVDLAVLRVSEVADFYGVLMENDGPDTKLANHLLARISAQSCS